MKNTSEYSGVFSFDIEKYDLQLNITSDKVPAGFRSRLHH